MLGVSKSTANRIVRELVEIGILDETTGQRRSRIFRHSAYLALFEDQPTNVGDTPVQATAAVT